MTAMTPALIIFITLSACILVVTAVAGWHIRRRNLHFWLGSYVWQSLARRRWSRTPSGEIHVLLCIADHFEPAGGGASDEVADERVAAWVRDYPRVLGHFRDSDGRAPRHTFFYPLDEYEPRRIDAIAGLCKAGFGEVEIHLHHENDTAENLEATLQQCARMFADRHGLLGRRRDNNEIAYGFVHGNWALDNSRPDGHCCGVSNELDVLHRTGCYADFTMPSAPDVTQTRKINSIYYAKGAAGRCKAHDDGVDVGSAPMAPEGSLMLIQGPLSLSWLRGRPRIENGCIQGSQPPTIDRLDQWLLARVQVPQRADWFFVKLHTHGATEANRNVLLGEATAGFHRALAERAANDPRFHFHYVTARELYNLAKAAEAGWTGPIAAALDYAIAPPPKNSGQYVAKG